MLSSRLVLLDVYNAKQLVLNIKKSTTATCLGTLSNHYYHFLMSRQPLLSRCTQITTHLQPQTPKMPHSAARQPLKILMLHGYTQSGSLFHAKTRALIKHLQKLFPLHDISPSYPTGPLRLDPADIPGYQPSSSDQEPTEAYGWWRRDDSAKPPLYSGIEDGLDTVAKTLKEDGPFDGVIGFSQGAAMAAIVASLLEPGRRDAFAYFSDAEKASEGSDLLPEQRTPCLPFPPSWEDLAHPPLKFALCYSGFRAPGPRYRAFYERPAIQSPVLHVLGSLDAVVDHGRSRALIEACEGDPEKEGNVVWHPGGHFLPSQRPFLDAAAGFIKQRLESRGSDHGEEEEDVRDMDLPF